MSISLTLNSSTPDEMLSDLQRLFPSLVAGTQLPPMQEQPRENREPLPAENVKEIEPPKQRKPRATKDKEPEVKTEDQGEKTEGAVAEAPKDSSSTSTDAAESTGTASGATEIPDIEDLRARLKALGATEGFGHDKVFEVLGKYGAKNASTVPEDKRADCIAEIDELLKGGK